MCRVVPSTTAFVPVERAIVAQHCRTPSHCRISAYAYDMNGQRPRLSMLRSYTAADALTIGNASCGTIAIFGCLEYLASGNPRMIWMAIA